jgi:fused signal recognition particle receptor
LVQAPVLSGRSRPRAAWCGSGPGSAARRTCSARACSACLSRDHLDEDAWEEIEDSLISADVGVEATQALVARLRERVRVLGTRTVAEVREQLAEELTAALEPDLDRSLRTAPHDGRPAVLLVVGVNGAGKTTTCGKIARVLIADGRTVCSARPTPSGPRPPSSSPPGASGSARDGPRPEGGDPASVAFDAVKRGHRHRVDTV